MEAIREKINLLLIQALDEYGLVIACLVIGILVGWNGKFLMSDRKHQKQIKIRFEDKDKEIARLSFLVHNRLKDVTAKKFDKNIFRGLKKYFKQNFKIKTK